MYRVAALILMLLTAGCGARSGDTTQDHSEEAHNTAVVAAFLDTLAEDMDLGPTTYNPAPGEATGLEGMTRVRASRLPGYCEQQRIWIELDPVRLRDAHEPTRPHAVEVRTASLFSFIGEPEDGADVVARDAACVRWAEDGAPRLYADDVETADLARRTVEALAASLTGRQAGWGCSPGAPCPEPAQVRAMLAPEQLRSATRILPDDCPDQRSCLILELTADNYDDNWRLALRPDPRAGYRSAVAQWSRPPVNQPEEHP